MSQSADPARETATRQRLLDRTREALDKIVARKKKGSTEKLSAQVGKILARSKMGKFVEWHVEDRPTQVAIQETHIEQEKLFDGCYIVSATVPKEQMNQDEVVRTYKNLSVVEQAFRNLKTVSLEIRPVYHKKDDRIRSHVFLCVLAFYLQWHMQQRLQPLCSRPMAKVKIVSGPLKM